ncbi:MAG: hypothetical protein IJ789_06080 [Bacteroidales bacterium]|nr:hypothetical protein [Bacteroidales bacterium]
MDDRKPGLEHYDVKVLLALTKSIGGRIDFFRLLAEGGYPELAAFSNAIRGDEDAMVWLFKHNYSWLAILSNAMDGEEKAQTWISKACSPVNIMFALASGNNQKAIRWLAERKLELFIMMAREAHKFLEYQAAENASPYTMNFGGSYRAAEQMREWLKEKANTTQPTN